MQDRIDRRHNPWDHQPKGILMPYGQILRLIRCLLANASCMDPRAQNITIYPCGGPEMRDGYAEVL